MKKNKIPTIVALFILLLGLAAGVFLVQNKKIFQPQASPDAAPKDIRITNIGDSSFNVSWVSEKPLISFVKWGSSASSLNKSETKDEALSGTTSFTHSFTINSLNPGTNYYFSINSGGSDFDNNGTPWQVKTALQPGNQRSQIASGSVVDVSNNPVGGALVYLTVGGGSPLSTTTSANGTWVVSISNVRSTELNSFLQISEDSLIDIFVNAGPAGVATAKVFPEVSKKTPQIILGKTLDFRNLSATTGTDSPFSTLELPDSQERVSKFRVGELNASGADKVSEESIVQGEVINTTTPQFFGSGPADTNITVKIESQLITKNLKVDANGKWKLDTPSELEPGSHRITITWTDSNGIVQSLTKSFVVMAAEGPAFSASDSASPTSSPTASPTFTPVPTPSLFPTISPVPEESLIAVATETPTTESLLDTGSLTPTILLFMMGIGTICLGFLVWKNSEG